MYYLWTFSRVNHVIRHVLEVDAKCMVAGMYLLSTRLQCKCKPTCCIYRSPSRAHLSCGFPVLKPWQSTKNIMITSSNNHESLKDKQLRCRSDTGAESRSATNTSRVKTGHQSVPISNCKLQQVPAQKKKKKKCHGRCARYHKIGIGTQLGRQRQPTAWNATCVG